LPENDAADLVQEVMTKLVTRLKDFQYDPTRRFRSWLRTITINAARDLYRRRPAEAPAVLSRLALADPEPSPSDLFEEKEYRTYLVARAMELLRGSLQRTTYRACWEYVIRGRPAAEIAEELGISVNAVYIAKCRVLRRLRQELDGLLD